MSNSRFPRDKSWAWWRRQKISEAATLFLYRTTAPKQGYALRQFLVGLREGLNALPDRDHLTFHGLPLPDLVVELERFRSSSVDSGIEYSVWTDVSQTFAYRAFAVTPTPSTAVAVCQLKGALLKAEALALPDQSNPNNTEASAAAQNIATLICDTAAQRYQSNADYQQILSWVSALLTLAEN